MEEEREGASGNGNGGGKPAMGGMKPNRLSFPDEKRKARSTLPLSFNSQSQMEKC